MKHVGSSAMVEWGACCGCSRRREVRPDIRERWQALADAWTRAVLRAEAVAFLGRRWNRIGTILRLHPWAVLDRLLFRVPHVRIGRIKNWVVRGR